MKETEWSLNFILGIGRPAKFFKKRNDMIKVYVSEDNCGLEDGWRLEQQSPARQERICSIHKVRQGLTEHFQALVQQGWRVCMTDGDYFQKVYILGELFKNINWMITQISNYNYDKEGKVQRSKKNI